MSDEQNSGTAAPPQLPVAGAFDWLVESHQQSAPMAPLTDDTSGPRAVDFDPEPSIPVQTAALPPVAEPPAASSFGGGFLFERRAVPSRSGNRPLDWTALVLAFVAPPVGLVLAIVAAITGSRANGYAATIAKAAIGIGAALSVVLGVGLVVETKISNDHAAHAAVVASSTAWCAGVTANPVTLRSDTFGWPAPGNTIPSTIKAITAYQTKWDGLAKVAPAGIRADTHKVAATAKAIGDDLRATQTLNDAGNVAQLQNVVATSGIKAWASDYCG